jgi:hypothetical protein
MGAPFVGPSEQGGGGEGIDDRIAQVDWMKFRCVVGSIR